MSKKEEKTEKKTEDIKNIVAISDVGPCKKKVSIEIPQEKIKLALDNDYQELRKEAVVPGFRKGKAPMRLIEKRFAKDISEQVKLKLLADAVDSVTKEHKLDTIGQEPDIDVAAIALPEDGPLKFEYETEVRPEFDLPELENIPVEKLKVEVKDEQLQEEIMELRKRAGYWIPVEGAKSQLGDQLIADVVVKVEGSDEDDKKEATEITIRQSGVVAGLPVKDMAAELSGLASGDFKKISIEVPKTFYDEQYREKKVDLEIKVNEVKQLQPAEMNEEFFQRYGVDDEAGLKAAIKENSEDAIERQVKAKMADDVRKYLLENTKFDLPADVVADQSARILQRRYINMMIEGMDREKIEAQMEELRTSSEETAKEQLKYFFVLDKIADKLDVKVSDEEVNGYIARMAAQRGKRPEKMRQDLLKDGSLADFTLQVREQRCLELILEKAKITEVEPEKKPKKKSAKKSEE